MYEQLTSYEKSNNTFTTCIYWVTKFKSNFNKIFEGRKEKEDFFGHPPWPRHHQALVDKVQAGAWEGGGRAFVHGGMPIAMAAS